MKITFANSGFTKDEWKIIQILSTPSKIQDYLNKLRFNHEENGETVQSPRRVIASQEAHCLEGALLAAAALWAHGGKPLLLDIVSTPSDMDHVVALYKKDGRWGAISKTNHSVLRYREPVYRDPRELAMSYFHEYFLDNGTKTMRLYSQPFDLSRLGQAWLTDEEDLFDLAERLDKSPHMSVMGPHQARTLRKADPIERQTSKVVEWKRHS